MPGEAPTGPDAAGARPDATADGGAPSTDVDEPGGPPRWLAPAGAAALLLVLVGVVVAARPSNGGPAVAAAPGTTATLGTTAPQATTSTTAVTTTVAPTTTSSEPPGTTTTTRKPHKTPTGPPGPLTGAPVDAPGAERRPALVVKIDNYDPDARPQAGLSHADVVYEEKVEGPYSRFAAVFQGSDAEQVGPVRSARSTDVQLVGPLNRPLFAYSGANGNFLALLSISPLIDVGAGARPNSYWRGGDKVIPHNLYTSTGSLWSGQAATPPAPLWAFRTDNRAPAGAKAATGVTYHFGGNMTNVNWAWNEDEGGWLRTQNGSVHYDQDNWPVTAQNVVIQYVHYQGADARDVFGNPIPEALLGGTGTGWILTAGVAAPLTWSRYALADRTEFVGVDDQPVQFSPGRTWVILVPVEYPVRVSFTDGTAAG